MGGQAVVKGPLSNFLTQVQSQRREKGEGDGKKGIGGRKKAQARG